MSNNPNFRLRSGSLRTGRAKLPSDSGQRQSEREDETRTGRDGGYRDVQGRQRPLRRGRVSHASSTEMHALAASFGVVPGATFTVAAVLDWYFERGIYVLPVHLGEKVPSIPWRELAEKETEPRKPSNTLESFEARHGRGIRPGEVNFAVLCGKPSGGLVVIDFDDEPKGREFPLATFTVATGKGLHYYVRVTDTLVSNRSFPQEKLDLRGQGGIAVIPPSVHPTGRLYRIENDHPIVDISAAQLEVYLQRILGHNALTDAPEAQAGWFEEAFGSTCAEGARNNTCTRLAGRLLAAGLNTTEAISVLSLWAEHNTSPTMPLAEVLACVRSIARREHAVQATNLANQPVANAQYTPGVEFGDGQAPDSDNPGTD